MKDDTVELVRALLDKHVGHWRYPAGLSPTDVEMNEALSSRNDVLDFEPTLPLTKQFFIRLGLPQPSERYLSFFRNQMIILGIAVRMAYGQFALPLTVGDVTVRIREEVLSASGRKIGYTIPTPSDDFDPEKVVEPLVITFACSR